MHFEGTVEIRAPRDRVWAFVIDPERVATCGPGVESVEVADGTHFRVRAKVGVGFVNARFTVDLETTDAVAPDRAVIRAHGQAPGSAVDGTAAMTLSDGPDGSTTMAWTTEVTVAGTLASAGARLIEGTAQRMIAQTFDCMRSKLETPAGTPPADDPAATP
ncbi:MAG: carbon monoxide dehydrogenase subunit G [Chloroflexi bacterium]|nr:carbon monoxide dehydrogenase subunit G [Chloroflexota bacterium]